MARLVLDKVLKKRGLSKRQFAILLGVRYDNVFRYFRKGYDPKLSKMSEWAKALKCKISDFYEE